MKTTTRTITFLTAAMVVTMSNKAWADTETSKSTVLPASYYSIFNSEALYNKFANAYDGVVFKGFDMGRQGHVEDLNITNIYPALLGLINTDEMNNSEYRQKCLGGFSHASNNIYPASYDLLANVGKNYDYCGYNPIKAIPSADANDTALSSYREDVKQWSVELVKEMVANGEGYKVPIVMDEGVSYNILVSIYKGINPEPNRDSQEDDNTNYYRAMQNFTKLYPTYDFKTILKDENLSKSFKLENDKEIRCGVSVDDWFASNWDIMNAESEEFLPSATKKCIVDNQISKMGYKLTTAVKKEAYVESEPMDDSRYEGFSRIRKHYLMEAIFNKQIKIDGVYEYKSITNFIR